MAKRTFKVWRGPKLSRDEATRRLTNRWHEVCVGTVHQVPLELYIKRNLPHVLREGLQLNSYK